MSTDGQSLQERYAPKNACFGCGPANDKGLRIRSFPGAGDEVVLEWTPQSHHSAFEGVLNGGIVGALMDCHSNWTAIYHLIQRDGLDEAPCCVTSDFHVKLKRPTPTTGPLEITAKAVSSEGDWVTVEASLTAGGKVCATCTGRFVQVNPGHPAYKRW